MAATARTNLPFLFLLLTALVGLLAHGSPLATPAAASGPRHLRPAPRLLSPAAQATPTTGPRLPYPIPDTYNGTAFGRPPRATGGWLRPSLTAPPPAQVTAPPPTTAGMGGGSGRNGTGGGFVAAAHKDIPFIQTTYWSCVQWPTTVHCGWHEPILAVGDAAVAAAPGGPAGRGTATAAARRAVAVAGAGLLAGFVLGFV